MPFATLDGRRIHYTDTGDLDARPALIFVHAYTCNASLWDGMIARFALHYRCLAIDLPGHGQSDPSDRASEMAYLAQGVLAVLDDAGVAKVHMCGLSIGGMIGQHLGLSHADRMLSLTLACTTGQLAPEAVEVWDGRLETITTKGLWAQIEESIERWYGDGLIADFGPADLDPIARMIGSTSVAGAVSCGLAVKAHDVLDQLGAITTPTLVLGADRDLSFPPQHPQALADAIAGAQLVMLENAGHLAPVQVPDAFELALRSFYATL
ncbi:MAG: alpha/beta fold hydrolase [Devosiaceae bacterium]